MKEKYLFLDRDGTLIHEPGDEQIDSLDKLELLPGLIRNLYKIQHFLGYKLVMVSNQDGLGTPGYPEWTFQRVQDKLLNLLKKEGIEFEGIHIDRSTADQPSVNRKPSTGMIDSYMSVIGKKCSYVVGDRMTDMEMANKAWLKGILIAPGKRESQQNGIMVVETWDEIYDRLRKAERTVDISRITNETHIRGKLSLDGTGLSDISTGLGFFDHMLDQVCKHGSIDLVLRVAGDLEVDEHHTIEDTGLALGEAFAKTLAVKKGLQRYGFTLPMDESSSSCLIDLGGRPNLLWNVTFQREYIGKLPTEMFEHFFKSFSDASQSTIHIQAQGTNEHHKTEAVFKAFARALQMAVKQDDRVEQLPSTKGLI